MFVGFGVLVGVEADGGLDPGTAVLEAVAVGSGGGCEGGVLVFVLVGTGLGVLVLVGALVHVGHTVAGVREAVGLTLAVVVVVAVTVSVSMEVEEVILVAVASAVGVGVLLALLESRSSPVSMANSVSGAIASGVLK